MQQHTSPGASKLRVLIVEDSAIIRARLMESLAEIPNIEIVGEVETEASALAAMADRHWDAAVLDLQLKQGTGLGLLKALAQAYLFFGYNKGGENGVRAADRALELDPGLPEPYCVKAREMKKQLAIITARRKSYQAG